jgi:hypothetical protein
MDFFHIPKVLPPNGSFLIQVENGYPSLLVFILVVDYEVLLQAE